MLYTCCMFFSRFSGRRHHHTLGWSLWSVVQNESGSDLIVCVACDRNVRHAYKAKESSQPFQSRWLKGRLQCAML